VSNGSSGGRGRKRDREGHEIDAATRQRLKELEKENKRLKSQARQAAAGQAGLGAGLDAGASNSEPDETQQMLVYTESDLDEADSKQTSLAELTNLKGALLHATAAAPALLKTPPHKGGAKMNKGLLSLGQGKPRGLTVRQLLGAPQLNNALHSGNLQRLTHATLPVVPTTVPHGHVLVPISKLRAFQSGVQQQREAILQAQLAAMRQRMEDLTYTGLLGGLETVDSGVAELLEPAEGRGWQ